METAAIGDIPIRSLAAGISSTRYEDTLKKRNWNLKHMPHRNITMICRTKRVIQAGEKMLAANWFSGNFSAAEMTAGDWRLAGDQ